MNKTTLIALIAIGILVVGAIVVSATYVNNEPIEPGENEVIETAQTCGVGSGCGPETCNGACGGTCGVRTCGCS